MRGAFFTVESNRALAPGVFELVLAGDCSAVQRPGQFVNVAVPGLFLRRPISISDWSANSMTFLVRTVGRGTAWLEKIARGEKLDLLLPLGNGFDISAVPDGGTAILAGGGIGIAPLYALAKALLASGRRCVAALGFRCASDVFYADEFAAIGCEVAIATEDGSRGQRGYVTDVVSAYCTHGRRGTEYLFACGPEPMLKALAANGWTSSAQFSLEARMGCGFGACMGCTTETTHGSARICHEGPVFRVEDLKW